MTKHIIQSINLSKSYHDGAHDIIVLKNINFSIEPGDSIAIVGPSGSGKSTLLHLLGGLDNPSFGDVLFEGRAFNKMSELKRCKLRNKYLGFIYQSHHLLLDFSAIENVALPLVLAGSKPKHALLHAEELLTTLGLEGRFSHRPSQLSGGEKQRVAIARALIHRPKCVFADEPTGQLDNVTATKVFAEMLSLNAISNTALIVVTHDLSLAAKMHKVYQLHDGKLVLQS
jgi:lipoprotein-releasing system ATP-binding protein